jgi:hypothetical protein
MPRYLTATVLTICVSATAGLVAREARAASPYVVDGIALGASLQPAREFQCSASEQFAEYTWCQRKRQERGRQGSFSSTNSILHGREGSVAYVNREIRPAFFAGNDIQAEIKRLSARFGAPARETRLPAREDLSHAVIALWGSLQLEELDGKSLSALESGALSQQSLFVDHLGDLRQSLQQGLPVYRLKGGAGYLWSAASDRSGRGHLRFLAIDVAALAATKDGAALTPKKVVSALSAAKDGAALAPKKDVGALSAAKDGPALAATNDLRPFLTPQPTSIVPNDAGKQAVSQTRDKTQQSIVQKTPIDAERARIMDAERMAGEERTKARLAWARFEAEKAAYEARARVKWIVVASLFILIAILALLRVMTRQEEQAPSPEARTIGRKAVQAVACLWVHRGRDFFQHIGAHFATLMMKARATLTPKSILATHERS